MAITNKLGVWGKSGDYGTTWYEVSQGRIEGFQANSINYASKMNQALANATLLSYTFAEILSTDPAVSDTFTIGAQEVDTIEKLETFVENMQSAINSYLSNKTVANATKSTNSDYATKIGTNSNHPSVGSSVVPVYVYSDGKIKQCSLYGGGTKVTLNGSDKGAQSISIYAPTSTGTINQILKSNGSGSPSWVDAVTYTPIKRSAQTTTTLSANKTYLIVPSPGASITLTQYISFYTIGSETEYTKTKITTIYGPMWINTHEVEQEGDFTEQRRALVKSTVTSGTTSMDLTVNGDEYRFFNDPTNTITITSNSAYIYYDMTVSM